MKRFKYIIPIVLFVAILLPMTVLAEEPLGGGEIETPLDGGLSLLLAAGVGYGAKKMKEKRQNKNRIES
jgi:hypothetical protein